MTNWRDDLQIKDPVAISGNHYNPPRLTHVQRITKTLIVTTGNVRWNKVYGTQPGSQGYNRQRLLQWTKDIEEEIERHKLESWLSQLAHRVDRKEITLTLDCLRRMRKNHD